MCQRFCAKVLPIAFGLAFGDSSAHVATYWTRKSTYITFETGTFKLKICYTLTLFTFFMVPVSENDLAGHPRLPKMEQQQSISCLHSSTLPKENRKEMKERRCFLYSS
ncbi:hypothetical protein SRHO_G00156330 [Serrasalmus rhombeus]